MPPDSPDEVLRQIDWDESLDSARRRLRHHMSGFNAQDIEDAAQEVMLRLILFVRRGEVPHSDHALIEDMARKVSANAIAQRRRERQQWLQTNSPEDFEAPKEADDFGVLEGIRAKLFLTREYLRRHHPEWIPCFDARLRGESLKEFAARTQQSYDAVRQAWVRCAAFICEASEKGRLRLGWEPPDSQESPDD